MERAALDLVLPVHNEAVGVALRLEEVVCGRERILCVAPHELRAMIQRRAQLRCIPR